MAVTALLNAPFLLRLRRSPSSPRPPDQPTRVSLLVPARNEARVIGRTVAALLAQTYPRFELLVLDDDSADETAELAGRAAGADSRFRLLRGQPLPSGWLGKNWACAQLAAAAQGDLLVFTDADVAWQPDALAALVEQMARSGADLLTVWPTQTTLSWGERLTVPLMALAILAYLPLAAVHYLPWPVFAAANGQCLAFRRSAYTAVGGHHAVRNNVVEDVALARLAKARGLRLRLYDGNRLIGCRMYESWDEARRGYAKNILAGHANSVPLLALSTVAHWLVFVGPWGWLPIALLRGGAWLPPLLLWLTTVGVRALTAALTHQRLRDALLMPVSVALMTRIAADAVLGRRRGGAEWKGRIVPSGE